jgi:hypothetical protein
MPSARNRGSKKNRKIFVADPNQRMLARDRAV